MQKKEIEMKAQVMLILLAGSFLTGCGSEAETEESKLNDAVTTEAQAPKRAAPSNNPLAGEQQLIQDAKNLQNILNQDAEDKKKALEESLN